MRYGITPPIWWPFRWWPSSTGFNPGKGIWKMRVTSRQATMDGDTFKAGMYASTFHIGSMEGTDKTAKINGISNMATMTAV